MTACLGLVNKLGFVFDRARTRPTRKENVGLFVIGRVFLTPTVDAAAGQKWKIISLHVLIPTVGEWSRDKHYYLKRYIDAFTTSMKGDKWESLHYIDLFAGAGIERMENSNELDWGSPMIAAQAPFTKLHLCERQNDKYDTLKKRIIQIRPDSQILKGDSNQNIHDIINEIPPRSLSLAFLDPYGLHLDFQTLVIISKRRADLIIFFPDYLDVIRNWVKYYYENQDSNLDRFLGRNQIGVRF